MNIIKSSVEEIINETPGKKIEVAGRTCYKSDSNINDTSYIKFISNIVKSGHCSVLEHERVCIKYDLRKGDPFATISQKDHMKFFNISQGKEEGIMYVSANIRGWLDATSAPDIYYDNGTYAILKELYPFVFTRELKNTYLVEGATLDYPVCAEYVKESDIPEEIRELHDSKTFKIICNRSTSHQIVRHRSLSFSQQSQRYCNFSNDKFGHSIDFIMPEFKCNKKNLAADDEAIENIFKSAFEHAELEYFDLIDDGLKPEDAREVLPNAAATIIVVTGTTNDWRKFIELRDSTHAQTEIRGLAQAIRTKLKV